MPFNAQKIANLILKECEVVEDKCDGYNEKLVAAIVKILKAEREHNVKGINIRQLVTETCKETGNFLAENRSMDETVEEEIL